MKKIHKFISAFILLGLLLVTASASAAPGDTTRVSVDSSGTQGNSDSTAPSISADGRYVAFVSRSTNLVSGDTNGRSDIFVHDRTTGVTERVSVDSSGTQGNDSSSYASVSANGRYVVFDSMSTNLVVGDTNGVGDVFVHDRNTSATIRVSISTGGGEGNNASVSGSISNDGRYVVFSSSASNLVSGDTNGMGDIFVHDRNTNTTTRVSISSSGTQGNNYSYAPSISFDGRYVTFTSGSSNLVDGDTNGMGDIFVHDRNTNATTRVSISSSGTQGNNNSYGPSISSDGRYVTFYSSASNLVNEDTNGVLDVFLHDRDMNITTRISVDSSGIQANSDSGDSYISSDGRYVVFTSLASNLVTGDVDGMLDVFVHNIRANTTMRVSLSSLGNAGNADSRYPAISSNGSYIAFGSAASNLMGGDTNGVFDIFVRELDTDAPLVASTNLSAAYTSTGPSSFAVTFSEAVNNAGGGTGTDDAANPNNYVVLEQGSVSGFQTTACNNINTTQDTRVTPSGVTYIPNTAIVNFGSPLPAGTYRLFVCGTTSIVDLAGNALAGDGTNSGTDFTFDFTVGAADPPPTVPSHTLQAAYTSTGPSSFTVTFSENVSNVGGGAGTDDAANPNNYVLMEQGSVSGFQTTACNNINATQDTRVTPSGVTYIPNTAIVNLGSALPVGSYRLFVCGTTSIIDLAGNHLNNGVDFTFDFSVAAAAVVNPPSAVTSSESRNANGRNSGNRWLPNTGFVPNVVTRLPEQPVELVYTKMSDLWLEIPSQKVKANIVGVPQSENAWDVKWLGNDTGWLNGTAFPSWEGNSVLTGHVMGADGLPGPFAKLQDLKYGERIIVHILDQQYVFEVRNKRLVRPDSTAFAFEHLEDASYLTLITCSGYNEEKNTYSFRRLVRAVLVEIK